MFRFSVVAAVASYMAISISIVLVNKHLLGGRVPYPVAMTWAQMVVALPCFAAVYLVSRATGVPAQWPAPRIELRTALAVLPVSATFVAMVTLNNACLSRVEAAFYMVARSSHIFFSIVLTRVLLGSSSSMFKVGSCAVVTAGLVVGAFGEGPRFSAAGTGLGIASTFFVALYAVLVRRHTDAVGGSMWRLAWYNTVLSCALLPIVAVLSGEFGAASAASMAHGGRGDLAGTLVELTGGRAAAVALTVSGILGFLVSLASYAQITLTDPLTHMVSGTVKGLLQTFIGAWVFGTPLTALNLAGSVLVVAGSLAYSLIRMSESREAAENKDGAAVKSKKSQ